MSINKLALASMAAFAVLLSGSLPVKASPIIGAALSSVGSAKYTVLTESSQAGQSLWIGQSEAKIIKVRERNVGMRSSSNRRLLASRRVNRGHRGRTKTVPRSRRTVVVGTRGARYVGHPRRYRSPTRPIIRQVYVPRRARGRAVYIYPEVYGVRYKLRRCYHPQIRRYFFARDCRIAVKRVWFR